MKWLQANGRHVYVYAFQNLTHWFLERWLKKKRWLYVHVLMNSHVFFLKHFNKLWVFLRPLTNRPTHCRPTTTNHPTTDQMHWPTTNQPPTSKKSEDQKKIKFIFDISPQISYWLVVGWSVVRGKWSVSRWF